MKYIILISMIIPSMLFFILLYLTGLIWHLNTERAYEFTDWLEKVFEKAAAHQFPYQSK